MKNGSENQNRTNHIGQGGGPQAGKENLDKDQSDDRDSRILKQAVEGIRIGGQEMKQQIDEGPSVEKAVDLMVKTVSGHGPGRLKGEI